MLCRGRFARLAFETLEDRTTPAGTFTWLGGDAMKPTDFFTKANWSYAGTDAHDYPGQTNRNDDKIIFNNTATQNCDVALTSDLSVLSLELKSNFTKTLTVTGPNGIIVRPQGTNKADFEMAGGTLTLKGAAYLSLEKIDTNMGDPQAVWSGGDLSSTGDANARIYLYSTTFLVKETAQSLGATLVVGESKAGTPGAVTMYLGTIGSAMAGNLKLYNNADIQVKSLGLLALGQQANTNTKGGIDVVGASSTSKIDNEGTIIRPYGDTTAPANFLLVKPKVSNKLDGSKVILGVGAKVNFAGGADLLKGELKMSPGAKTDGTIKALGGAVHLDSSGLAPGTYDVSFLGDLEIQGALQIDSVAGVFFTVDVGGDLTLDAGATVMINVNGATTGQSDTLLVAGQTYLNGANLLVNTQGTSPSSNATYDFLQSAGGTTGTGWGAIQQAGVLADYVFESPDLLGVAGMVPLSPAIGVVGMLPSTPGISMTA
jgi:hypothetical protein